MKNSIRLSFIAIATLGFWNAVAIAGEPLAIKTDSSQLVSLSTEAGTVVIGNPSIADVTLDGKHLFIHGRAYGETNLLILDKIGNQIVNFDITVVENTANALTVYRGVLHDTYSCAPNCNPTMTVGNTSLMATIDANVTKNGFATGKFTVEAKDLKKTSE